MQPVQSCPHLHEEQREPASIEMSMLRCSAAFLLNANTIAPAQNSTNSTQ
jgi:hypothetical protein